MKKLIYVLIFTLLLTGCTLKSESEGCPVVETKTNC